MIYDFDIFSVDLIIDSDSTLYWKDRKTGQEESENTKTIHTDKYKTLVSWLETNKTFVTMFSDFQKGKAYAFLYWDDGRIMPVTGSIKMKE
ncbi:MAG: hypothetical protein ABI550_08895 [Ignavibacteriaceae bacterium]